MKGSVALVVYEGPNLSTVFLVSAGAPVIPYALVWWPRLCVLYLPTKTLRDRLRPIGNIIKASSRARQTKWAFDVRTEFRMMASKFCSFGSRHQASDMIHNLGARILRH